MDPDQVRSDLSNPDPELAFWIRVSNTDLANTKGLIIKNQPLQSYKTGTYAFADFDPDSKLAEN